MLFNNNFFKNAVTGVIAPHGITDLFHAEQNNLIPQLYSINLLTVISTLAIDKFNHPLLEIMFYAVSAYHFRNDMPNLKNINPFFISIAMLSSFFVFDPKLFLYYMIFIHVPNHYLMNWDVLKNDKKRSILIISLTSVISMFIGTTDLIENHLVQTISQGLIFSHIIYEESFIFSNTTKTIE